MRIAKTAAAAAALLLGVGAMLSGATPASAYPAGQYLTLELDHTTVLVPGSTIHGTISHVKHGCVVAVRILQTERVARYFTAANNDTVSLFSITTPSDYGVYTIKASTTSACSGGAESDAVTLTVGKATTLTSALSAKNNIVVVKNKPTFLVSGTLKYGAVKVANATVFAQIIRPNATKGARYQTRTNSQGQYSFTMTGQATVAGAYFAYVTFSGSGAYLPSSSSSSSVTLTTPLR